jgi:hypothetical protein
MPTLVINTLGGMADPSPINSDLPFVRHRCEGAQPRLMCLPILKVSGGDTVAVLEAQNDRVYLSE